MKLLTNIKTISLAAWLRRLLPLQSSDIYRGMFLAFVVGLIAGLGAVVFRELIQLFQTAFFDGGRHVFSFLGEYFIILIPALGGLFVGPLIYFLQEKPKATGCPR